MKRKGIALAIGLGFAAQAGAEEAVYELPSITVTAPFAAVAAPLREIPDALDSSSFVNLDPAGAVRSNGQLTGIAGIRGQFGDRVKVLVDGAEITPACPNHMDPPLHYISPSEVGEMEVLPGTDSVAFSGDSTGGTIIARRKPLSFDRSPVFTVGGVVAEENRRGYVSGQVGSENVALRLRGEWASADDYSSPLGTVRDTGFDQNSGSVDLAAKGENWNLDGRLGKVRTRDAGTPALPMDMVKDDADQANIRYKGRYAFGNVEVSAYHHDIDHLMDNYSLRPVGTMKMKSPASSQDNGLRVDFLLPRGQDSWRFGVDYHNNDFNAYSIAANDAPMSRRDMFNDGNRERFGVYGEWRRQWTDGWGLVAGARADQVAMSAGQIVNRGMAATKEQMAQLMKDANSFNSSNLDQTDNNWDASIAATYKQGNGNYELAFARKTRSPSLLERFLWTPLSASAGLADGRNYMGDPNLKPEVSHGVSASAEWRLDKVVVAPSVYYNRVSDYIQGQAGLYAANPSVLTFSNVGTADIWGFDGGVRYAPAEYWRLSATLSYVRGKVSGDNLYRMPPLRARFLAEHDIASWTLAGEWLLAARQTDVAAYNGETETPGYGVVNLRARYNIRKDGFVTVGINNLFDQYYMDALSGVNRVMGSAVPVGQRLPGASRYAYVAAEYRW